MSRSRHLNRCAIFLKRQNPALDKPAHSASRTLAALLASARMLTFLDDRHDRAQLRTSESWRKVKARFRVGEDRVVIVKLLPPLDYYGAALAPYPPVPRNERERAAQEYRWMHADKFAGSF